MTKKIAIIGSGVSGLTCAALLSKEYDITVFEAGNYLGGHACTVEVEIAGNRYPIDTGFVVFNEKTYPNFVRLLKKFNIAYEPTEMSFSYRSDETQFEYNGHSINSLFADRLNLLNPKFYQFLVDIIRFNIAAKKLGHALNDQTTLDHFIKQSRYSELFLRAYLMPIIASIWSKKMKQVWDFPARFLFGFMDNHGLLNVVSRPTWYTISGGSCHYVNAFIASTDKVYLNQAVRSIKRYSNYVSVQTEQGEYQFDKVIIAVHTDQALSILSDASGEESQLLGAISYTANESILHTDTNLLPVNKRAWASWNYYEVGSLVSTLTYYMNRLQNLKCDKAICLSTNLQHKIQPDKIIQRFQYAHPSFSTQSIIAQQHKSLINGKNNTYFCGAYWGYGFHEDGVNSALAVCELLGINL